MHTQTYAYNPPHTHTHTVEHGLLSLDIKIKQIPIDLLDNWYMLLEALRERNRMCSMMGSVVKKRKSGREDKRRDRGGRERACCCRKCARRLKSSTVHYTHPGIGVKHVMLHTHTKIHPLEIPSVHLWWVKLGRHLCHGQGEAQWWGRKSGLPALPCPALSNNTNTLYSDAGTSTCIKHTYTDMHKQLICWICI